MRREPLSTSPSTSATSLLERNTHTRVVLAAHQGVTNHKAACVLLLATAIHPPTSLAYWNSIISSHLDRHSNNNSDPFTTQKPFLSGFLKNQNARVLDRITNRSKETATYKNRISSTYTVFSFTLGGILSTENHSICSHNNSSHPS